MSWSVMKAAKAVEIEHAFAEGGKSYTEPKTQRILAALKTVVAEMAEGHGERVVTVETSGHVDGYSGSSTLTIRIWP